DSPELEEQVRQAQSDLRIAADLERVRESRPYRPDSALDNRPGVRDFIDYRQRATDYQEAFERAGLRIGDDPEPLAAFIRGSPIRDQLVAALDDRALVAFMLEDGLLAEQILRITRSADPEPRWGDRFRNPAVWRSREQLE